MDMTPDELRAELARLQAENTRLRDRLDARDELLTNTLKALAHAKEPDTDGKNVMVLYTNVRGWMWVMGMLGRFLIWLSAAAAAAYGLYRLIRYGA